ncbi:MAG: methylated-DNA--[protein]-cysteine S-methyltransferase [Candidatus Thiosymbion ectosymbiont of Robbea hypermnestra]|nr:methylated-DNA--[protein]-cysteine S-methyltransferase [Candidatus Thiosymbion ectosymbiont of Robbea hypermnestra]
MRSKIADHKTTTLPTQDMNALKASVDTPIGFIGILVEDGRLCGVELEPDRTGGTEDAPPAAVREQLRAYFEDAGHGFDLPLNLRGTAFQRRVWAALREIPAGCTVTYGELAHRLGTGARAIGGACRANPCPIVVPCHRVVAGNGLGGFAGDASGRKLAIKRWLLRHEGAVLPPISCQVPGGVLN